MDSRQVTEERKAREIVESLLGEGTVTEGDARGLVSALEDFERVFTGTDLQHTFESLQSVSGDLWGHIPGEVTGTLKTRFETARVALANLATAGKAALAKVKAYKPQKAFPGYDSAAHSGEHALTPHGFGSAD